MDEQRIEAYVKLVQQLLGCTNGEELVVLQQHAELVDGGLLAVIAQMVNLLEQQGNQDAAAWLQQFAQQLAARLGGEEDTPIAESSMQESLAFLVEVPQLVADSQGDAKQVYSFLAEHQHQLNDTLLQAIPMAASSLFNGDTNQLAFVAAWFGYLIAPFPLGKRGLNLELAIAAYQLALQVRTREAFPVQWAATQNNLAIAYFNRIRGDRADNLEQAIAAYQLALQVRTLISLPIGLLQAGVAGVAASLWSVSDLSTMMLVTRFYNFWHIDKLEIDQALHQAQRWVRDTTNEEKATYFEGYIPILSGSRMPQETAEFLDRAIGFKKANARDFAHPFHWAAFSYVGV